jgi:hypothetical protein
VSKRDWVISIVAGFVLAAQCCAILAGKTECAFGAVFTFGNTGIVGVQCVGGCFGAWMMRGCLPSDWANHASAVLAHGKPPIGCYPEYTSIWLPSWSLGHIRVQDMFGGKLLDVSRGGIMFSPGLLFVVIEATTVILWAAWTERARRKRARATGTLTRQLPHGDTAERAGLNRSVGAEGVPTPWIGFISLFLLCSLAAGRAFDIPMSFDAWTVGPARSFGITANDRDTGAWAFDTDIARLELFEGSSVTYISPIGVDLVSSPPLDSPPTWGFSVRSFSLYKNNAAISFSVPIPSSGIYAFGGSRGPKLLVPTAGWEVETLSELQPFVLAVIAIISTLRFYRRARDARRRSLGLCARCKYDLRASPLRCPECGAVNANGENGDGENVTSTFFGANEKRVTREQKRGGLRRHHGDHQ